MHQHSPTLWTLRSETWMGPGVCFPNTMTVLRRSDGGLVLHSPIALDETQAQAIDALGPVTDIIAPNLMHHLHAQATKERYPQATLWGPPGLAEKEGLSLDRTLSADAEIPGLQCIPLPSGPKLGEHVFLHPDSGTLVTCDLIFNMQAPKGWAMPMILRMVGCHGCASTSKSLKWVFVKDDFPAFARSVKGLESLHFERLIMNHGQVIDTHAKQRFIDATAWLHA